MSSYFIHHLGGQLGPWSKDQVQEKIQSKEIHITDYVFDEEHKEWVLICDSPVFAEYFRSLSDKMSKNLFQGSNSEYVGSASGEHHREYPNQNIHGHSAGHQSAVHEYADTDVLPPPWYILKNENKFGPYAYLDLVRMLQTKQLMEYDFIFQDGMDGWKTVAEISDFSEQKIRSLKDSGHLEIAEVFFRRRYLRTEYGASILIHDNKKVWKGQSLEISPGGAGFYVDGDDVSAKVGQNLFLHFKAGDGVPPFNAVCMVVNRTVKMGTHPGERAKTKFGVKFTNVSQNVQMAIKTFSESQKNKSAA